MENSCGSLVVLSMVSFQELSASQKWCPKSSAFKRTLRPTNGLEGKPFNELLLIVECYRCETSNYPFVSMTFESSTIDLPCSENSRNIMVSSRILLKCPTMWSFVFLPRAYIPLHPIINGRYTVMITGRRFKSTPQIPLFNCEIGDTPNIILSPVSSTKIS